MIVVYIALMYHDLTDVSPLKIKLNLMHRQSDTTLIKYINAFEKGHVSDEDVAFINSLSRSLENEGKLCSSFFQKY